MKKSMAANARSLVIFLLVMSTALGVFVTRLGGAGAGQLRGAVDAARVLAGSIDLHLHTDPDLSSEERSMDAIDVARVARSRAMRGIVLKNHYDSTALLAFVVRKEVPGLEVFGGIDLNRTMGGINVAAVEHMTQLKGGWGRVVWMSTHDSENSVRSSKQNRPFVSVSRSGELLPEVKDVISVIAKHGLVLATGHVSAEESLMLVREGRSQGAQHMLVTHAMDGAGRMNVTQMQQAAKLGAFVEFDYRNVLTGGRVEAMRKVGPEFCVLSEFWTAPGDKEYGGLDGVGAFVAAIGAQGVTEQDLARMMKENPARLLGLSPR